MADYSSKDTKDWSATNDRQFDPSFIPEQRPPLDELLSLLSYRRRRDTLYYISDHETASLESLATSIAAREADIPAENVSADEREAVLIDLYHNHLPKLADQRLIEYDSRSGAIMWSSPPDNLEELLECCHALEAETE